MREYDGLQYFLLKNVSSNLSNPQFWLFKNHSHLDFRKGRAIAINLTTIYWKREKKCPEPWSPNKSCGKRPLFLQGVSRIFLGAGVGNLYFLCWACAVKVLETQSLSVESAP
jgi:hypothetical protein